MAPKKLYLGNAKHDEWAALTAAERTQLEGAKSTETYEPNRPIFAQGSPCLGIYHIDEGLVAVRKQDHEGKSIIVRLAHGGQSLGYRAFFAGQNYTHHPGRAQVHIDP